MAVTTPETSVSQTTTISRANHDSQARVVLSDHVIATLLFVVTFAVYALTFCRTIYTGDDGDFITAIVTGGTPHPTGYPLFCLVGKLVVTLLPIGEPAFRINLMTALFGAAAIPLFYRLVRLLVPERFLAASAALILAYAPTLWQQSLSCEVYSLTCCFLVALLYLVTRWRQQPQNTRVLLWLTFLYGLACTNHLTIVLFLPAFLTLVLTTRPSLLGREIKVLGQMVCVFLLPLSLWGYLFIEGRSDAPVNWGKTDTLPAFWEHVSGRQYQDAMFHTPQLLLPHLKIYGAILLAEYGWWLLWLVPIGVYTLTKQGSGERKDDSDSKRGIGFLLLFVWFANVIYAINYNIFDIYVYYLPSHIITAVFLCVGASTVLRFVYERLRLDESSRRHYSALAAPVLLTIPLFQMSLHYAATDKSHNYLEKDFGENILRSAPPNAIVVVGGNVIFTLWYEKYVLHRRTDVTVIDYSLIRNLGAGNKWYYLQVCRQYPEFREFVANSHLNRVQVLGGEFFVAFLRDRVAHGVPVMLVPDPRDYEVRALPKTNTYKELVDRNFDCAPWGLTVRLFLKGGAPAAKDVVQLNKQLWPTFQVRGLYTGWAHNDDLQSHIPIRYQEEQLFVAHWAEEAKDWVYADAVYAQTERLYLDQVAAEGRARCAAALKKSGETRPVNKP